MVRGKTTTLCRSRDEPGGVKAQRRSFNAVFGAWLGARIFSQAFAAVTQFAGRSKAQAHCLRSGGLAPRSLSRVHNPDWQTVFCFVARRSEAVKLERRN